MVLTNYLNCKQHVLEKGQNILSSSVDAFDGLRVLSSN